MANRTRKDGLPIAGADTTPKDSLLVDIGLRVLNARRRLGWKQGELAEKAGLNQSTVFLLENGKQNASIKALEALAHALNLRIRDLLPGEDAPVTVEPADIKQVTDSLVGLLGRLTMLMHQLESARGSSEDAERDSPPESKRKR